MLRHLATYLLASVDNLLEVVLGGESLDSGDSLPPVPLFDPDVDQPVLPLLRRHRRLLGCGFLGSRWLLWVKKPGLME